MPTKWTIYRWTIPATGAIQININDTDKLNTDNADSTDNTNSTDTTVNTDNTDNTDNNDNPDNTDDTHDFLRLVKQCGRVSGPTADTAHQPGSATPG